jgi:hypothetical protein
MAYFKVISRHSPGKIERNDEKPQYIQYVGVGSARYPKI